MTVKIRLKGHESFSLREGWLRKGIAAIEEYNLPNMTDEDAKDIFSRDDAVDILGVGSNMVKSIKYWLQACGLIEELRTKKGRRISKLSQPFGMLINKYDPYFEEIFTLWLMHYKLVTNKENATAWYVFFNDLKAQEFRKKELFDGLSLSLSKLDPEIGFSEKSLQDDCSCIIKTYYSNHEDLISPEESLSSPLVELGLIGCKNSSNEKEVFYKKKPQKDALDPLVVLYVILEQLGNEKSTTIDRLISDDCNVGNVFNLDRVQVNYYLDSLERLGYIEVNRTAGLDTVYLKSKIRCEDVLENYYEQLRSEA
ncbi:DUF4007 family protein [Clostridium sp. YIM B02515]|uniref:DUF4007 family protein n=1 Tax=Clostridium rhizosphaerae TaxID=2803861 RepID=A0ABS1T8A8_9CLOT|nr:DUF4007 family protein [Clostridium rhizosphaerae]MBL4935574.1 DUF4007 family protein [Clostridium rhizosphaerae]